MKLSYISDDYLFTWNMNIFALYELCIKYSLLNKIRKKTHHGCMIYSELFKVVAHVFSVLLISWLYYEGQVISAYLKCWSINIYVLTIVHNVYITNYNGLTFFIIFLFHVYSCLVIVKDNMNMSLLTGPMTFDSYL
jgi:hypothetical protein